MFSVAQGGTTVEPGPSRPTRPGLPHWTPDHGRLRSPGAALGPSRTLGAALQHAHLQPRPRQITCRGQAIVTRADDYGVKSGSCGQDEFLPHRSAGEPRRYLLITQADTRTGGFLSSVGKLWSTADKKHATVRWRQRRSCAALINRAPHESPSHDTPRWCNSPLSLAGALGQTTNRGGRSS